MNCGELYARCRELMERIERAVSDAGLSICCASEFPKARRELEERIERAASMFCGYLFNTDDEEERERYRAARDEREAMKLAEDISDCPLKLIHSAFLPCYRKFVKEEYVESCDFLKAFVRALVVGFALCKYARRAVLSHALPELVPIDGEQEYADLLIEYDECLSELLNSGCKERQVLWEFGAPSLFDSVLVTIMMYAGEAGCLEDVIAEFFRTYKDMLDYVAKGD